MDRGQAAVDGERDGLGEQASADQRAEDVVVDVGAADPHLGDQPVRVAVAGVVAPREHRRRRLRRRDVGPRVTGRHRRRARRRRRSADGDRQRQQQRTAALCSARVRLTSFSLNSDCL